jgi:2-amino-4-hydroxy-6-hydroxymethyldihydropteridine diphosphokinase
MATAYLGLGSNIGDRIKCIKSAIKLLNKNPQIEVIKTSSFYESEPLEYPNQAWFVNAVVMIETSLKPGELLKVAADIETELERVRTIRWGPRTIDIDILLYDQELVSTSELQIPHLRMHARAFVLIPLEEIAPEMKHPILNKTAKELFDQLSTPTIVRKIEKEKELEILPV